MKLCRLVSFLACFIFCGAADTTLRTAAAKRGVYVGAAINAGHLRTDAAYKSVAGSQYDLVTAENACKWSIQRQQGKWDFSDCDTVRDFTRTINGTFRGHNLCWGRYNPSWLPQLSASGKRAALITHIKAMAAHYKTDAFAWDVVNEAITDDGGATDPLKASDWYPDVPDYIDVAFKTAREAFGKTVKLFYNDYNIGSSTGWSQKKSDRVYDYVKGMLARGVPIDGVGLQMHISSGSNEVAGLKANMERLGALGLEVHITELDISFDSWGAAQEEQQATMYADLLQACLDVPACKNFETWGFTDKYTWKGTDKRPLPFDESFQPKKAVSSMIGVLTGSPSPAPSPPGPAPAHEYELLTQTCNNGKAITGALSVSSVAGCKALCDAQLGCNSLDTDGQQCYLKSHCEGDVGECSGWCGYRLKQSSTEVVV